MQLAQDRIQLWALMIAVLSVRSALAEIYFCRNISVRTQFSFNLIVS